jgi:hypothetical protein
MLPAPMVLPRIHLPDWVGMVVLDLDCLLVEARDRSWEGWAEAPLLAVADGGISGGG